MATNRYILDGKTPVPCPDMMKWAKWFETADRGVARKGAENLYVSTVFLSHDHSYGDGPPMLFETMVFRDGAGDECERCSTWEEAEAQHERVCKEVLGEE